MLNMSARLNPNQHISGREHQRRLHFTPIEYTINSCIYNDFTRDISGGGLFIITQESHLQGDRVTAVFKPPAGMNHVLCTGIIVRIASSGIGLKFNCIWKFNFDYPDDYS